MNGVETTKIERTFHLSVYRGGNHITKGYAQDIDPLYDHDMSFWESLSPLNDMITAFKHLPLGTRIKVIMEVDKP